MKRYLVLLAATAMQTCLGGIYAWSVFVPPLQADFGFTAAQTQIVFGTCISVFTLSMIFSGRLQDRYGPRRLSVVSGLLLAFSYLAAAAAGHSFFLLWLAIGLAGGLGIGCGYVCPIATAVKWFPRHRGLVSGLAVAGYGGGAIVLATAVEVLLNRGWALPVIFRTIGIIYGSIIISTGLLLFLPAHASAEQALPFRRRVLLKDRRFWALCVGLACATLPGIMIIGNLKPIGLSFGLSSATAAAGISALALGNALGRILWGLLHDRLGARRSVIVLLCASGASVLCLIVAGHSAVGFLVMAGLVGMCYGGNFAVYPAVVAGLYGSHLLGTVYSLVLVSHGIGALVGPSLCGLSLDLTGSFAPALYLAVGGTLAGLMAHFVLSRSRGVQS